MTLNSSEITDQPAIEVENLYKRYVRPRTILQTLLPSSRLPQKEAVKGISFRLEQGRSLGIMGKNGSGKTTLLKVIATLLFPTSGSVRVLGRHSVVEQDSIRQMTSYVPADERSFFWRLSCRENLIFFGVLYGLSPAYVRQRINELTPKLHLESVIDDRFDTLSSGKKQLLSLTRGLLIKPRLLIVDEPTRSLDLETTDNVRSVLKSLLAEGSFSLLVSSHQLDDIENLCDQVILIDDGRIVDRFTREAPGEDILPRIRERFQRLAGENGAGQNSRPEPEQQELS